MLTSFVMPPNLYGAYRYIRSNTQLCWPRLSCHLISTIHISGLVHIDTYDPTRNRANIVCRATQSLAMHHHGIATNQSFQALIGNVSCVCLCRCDNMYINHQLIKSINSHQAYIIIPAQHLSNYITHLKVTRQWPLAVTRKKLAVATSKLAVAININNRGFPTWANLL